jgi:hypothetical protein
VHHDLIRLIIDVSISDTQLDVEWYSVMFFAWSEGFYIGRAYHVLKSCYLLMIKCNLFDPALDI